MQLLSKPGFNLLERSLDAASLRHKVIAHNVANVDTPHFKRSEVRFEELLQQQLQGQKPLEGLRTHPKHFYIGGTGYPGQPQVVKDEFSTINNNMNNVDIDYEMSLLAKNQLRYNTMIHQVSSEVKKLRTVINGRG